MSTLFRNHGAARDRIERFLAQTGRTAPTLSVVPLSGDASDRRYFRLQREEGRSEIVALYPHPIELSKLPFTNVLRLLEAMPVPAPRIVDHSDPLGIIVLDDLGDLTLQAYLEGEDRTNRRAVYQEALRLIHTLQTRGRELASAEYVPFGLAFDVEKLTWELHFFVTHFLEAHRRASLPPATRAALDSEFATITEELAAEPRVLCHRDYHSRNLMLHDGRLHLIDFQDARMGPDTYDLVSLLRDAYVDVVPSDVDELIDAFLALRGLENGADGAAEDFRRRFDLMATQRTIKALGTFGFQATTKENASYLQYVPRTLGYLKDTLAVYPRFGRLHELLAHSISELR